MELFVTFDTKNTLGFGFQKQIYVFVIKILCIYFGKNFLIKLFWLILGLFWFLKVTLVTFSCYLSPVTYHLSPVTNANSNRPSPC